MKSFVLSSLLLLLAVIRGDGSTAFQYVTCGSVLKLYNVESSDRLHSHDVKYGSGSGQQSVTGVSHADDVNSYWVVRGAHNQHCSRGAPVRCGSVLRLEHLNTHLYLHSHGHRSPLSSNQEVSCYGREGGEGDKGDNWVLECPNSNDLWHRDVPIRLKHEGTSMYLHITGQTYGRPIAGQKEVSAVSYTAKGNLWKAMEGVYMEPENSKV